MRVLILTQAVDTSDSVLGFFHSWLKEFSQTFTEIEVICLKEGPHTLPSNVSVHSLGKESGPSRFKYLYNLYRYVFSLKYDAVFVHMNEEYVLLAGWWWRLCGKKVVLWRNFATGSWQTPIACTIANTVCYTSPESYTSRFHNSVSMPIGIDTELFKPSAGVRPTPKSLLFFGRVDAVKRVELFVGALLHMHNLRQDFSADMYGEPTYPNSSYATDIKSQASPLVEAHKLSIYSSVPNTEAPKIFASHSIYVNLTPSGSFDKTIGEAMAAGCLVVTCNDAVREVMPQELFVSVATDESVAASIESACALSEAERVRITQEQRDFIEDKHSLKLLTSRLNAILNS